MDARMRQPVLAPLEEALRISPVDRAKFVDSALTFTVEHVDDNTYYVDIISTTGRATHLTWTRPVDQICHFLMEEFGPTDDLYDYWEPVGVEAERAADHATTVITHLKDLCTGDDTIVLAAASMLRDVFMDRWRAGNKSPENDDCITHAQWVVDAMCRYYAAKVE